MSVALTATNRIDGMIQVPESAHTLAGFREWVPTLPDKWKVALIGGEVFVEMGNEDIERHVNVKGTIFATLFQLVNSEDLGRIYQDGGSLTNETAFLSCNPDAVAVLWGTLESGRAKVVEEAGRFPEIQGTPDWVLEVVSPSSVAKDTQHLRETYHAAGIREYWLVDARRDPLTFAVLHWRKTGYVAATVKEEWQTSRVFGRQFRLTLSRRRGFRHYTLEMK